MAKKNTDQQSNVKDPLLSRVLSDYKDWYTFSNPYRLKWQNYWKQWNNGRVNQQYFGDYNTSVPMTFQMVETIVDNTYGGRPQVKFLPTDSDQERDTEMLNALWDYSWDKSNMDRIVIPWGREITINGNGMLFPEWADGYMSIKHIPMADCILDASAPEPDQMGFVGYRRLEIIQDLKDVQIFDPKAGEKDEDGNPRGAWVPRYKNLDKVTAWTSGDQTDAEQKATVEGTTLPNQMSKQCEVIYMAYLDKIVEIANRRVVIYEGPNPYRKDSYEIEVHVKDEKGEKLFDEQNLPEMADLMDPAELEKNLAPVTKKIKVPAIEPFLPFAMQREFVDSALLLAKGDVESISQTAEDLNDTVSMMQDNLAYNINNVAIIDKNASEAIEELSEASPGSIVPVEGGPSAVQWMVKPNMAPAAAEEIARQGDVIRSTMRVSAILDGQFGAGIKSAAEVNALVSQATSHFQTKTRALESEAYKRLGEMFVKMVQIFLTEEQMIRVVGKQGVEFKQFDPDKHWGDYDVKVVLDTTAKAQQKLDADKAMQVFGLLKDDPSINQEELKKMVLMKAFDMDDDDVDLLMTPATQNGAPIAPGTMPTDPAAGAPMPPEPSAVPPIGVMPPGMPIHG